MTTIMPPESPQSAQPAMDPLRPAHVDADRPATSRTVRMGALALAVAGVAVLGVMIYSTTRSMPSPADVPLIAADNTPFRERPAEEGGMTVANRDSTVFESPDPDSPQAGGLEQLVPEPEQPILTPRSAGDMPTPRRMNGSPALTEEEIRAVHRVRQHGDAAGQAVEQLETTARNVPPGVIAGQTSTYQETPPQVAAPAAGSPVPERMEPVQDSASPAAPEGVSPADSAEAAPAVTAAPDRTAPAASGTAAVSAAPAPQPAPVKPAPVARASSAPVSEKPPVAAAKPAATPRTASGTKMVQLGAVRSEAAAKTEWQRLQAKFRAQLGDLDLSVQRADLGARGVFWRVRGGPLSQVDAKRICQALSSAGQSCIVVDR